MLAKGRKSAHRVIKYMDKFYYTIAPTNHRHLKMEEEGKTSVKKLAEYNTNEVSASFAPQGLFIP
jgi:predicted CoA-binding protein